MIRRVLALLLLLAGPAAAQGAPGAVPPADAAAVRSVISRQLEAFRRDDASGAYRFAAPNIRTMFPSAPSFMDMVRNGYQPVYRSRDAEFMALERRDGELVQDVELVGPDGRAALARYTLVPDGNGGWLIAACILLPSARVGA